MSGGYAGKILRLDLTHRSASIINTSDYEQWVGGQGMCVAVFWDEVDRDYITDTHGKTGFEPENVICIMTGPVQGTLTPSGARCQVTGLAPEPYPRPQFSRSNFGGVFGPMMKFAGWDGIVIKGASDTPVWIDIRDDEVAFRDASGLWGLDTYETQEAIWRDFAGLSEYGEWIAVGDAYTTQRPAVLCIGQAGEHLARVATLQHQAACACGTNGFGGVWGSKGLKAISVVGTGSIPIAKPEELFATRQWYEHYRPTGNPGGRGNWDPWGTEHYGRPRCCFACNRACFQQPDNSMNDHAGAEGICVEAKFLNWEQYSHVHHLAQMIGYEETEIPDKDSDEAQHEGLDSAIGCSWEQRYGITGYMQYSCGVPWLVSLHRRGILGKGPEYRIQTDLDFSKAMTLEFGLEWLRRIAYREEIGDDLAEGIVRCAKKWGVFDEDIVSGALMNIYWCNEVHWGITVDWAYASLFEVRDMDTHFSREIVHPNRAEPDPEKRAQRWAELAPPWYDPMIADRSEDGVYGMPLAMATAWMRRWAAFYTGSVLVCDWNGPLFFSDLTPDGKGLTPEFETRFFNDVTGKDLSWAEGLEIGRKISNFERAIWVMHGRHRDEEYFPPFPPYDSYVYHEEYPLLQNARLAAGPQPGIMTVHKDGQWSEEDCAFPLSKDRMDDFKTVYYELEGWDPKTGWPTRSTLEDCGIGYVADELERRDRLGAE
jgi:aldehyde:ferredoxin oxidoreductase